MTDALQPYVILAADELEHRLASLARKAGRLREAAAERTCPSPLSREQLDGLMALVRAEATHLVVLQDLLARERRN